MVLTVKCEVEKEVLKRCYLGARFMVLEACTGLGLR